MDDRRFDQLARALATTRSRRQILRGLTASALAGGLVALGVKAGSQPSAAAQSTCGGANAQCSQDSDCCSGSCDTASGACTSPSEGDPCDPSSETSCNTAGLTCCADTNSSTGGTCTSVETGCSAGGQCRGAQAQCDQDSDCCSGKCLTDIHACSNATAGTPCDPSDAASCNVAGLVCCPDKESGTGGTCSPLAGGCLPAGQCHGAQAECRADADCCSGTCDTEQGICATASEGDPCDPGSETSCNTAGLTCCADANSGTGGTCTTVDSGCPSGNQPGNGNDQNEPGQPSPSGNGSVSSLPNTGSGPTAGGHDRLISASLLGAAGAVLVGHALHRPRTADESLPEHH